MINEEKLDNVLLELGHNDFNLGTGYLRTAVGMYQPGMGITKELYPALANAYHTTPSRVERAIRHSIEAAWLRSDRQTQLKWFGGSINPNTGKLSNGEYVARLARICREGIG